MPSAPTVYIYFTLFGVIAAGCICSTWLRGIHMMVKLLGWQQTFPRFHPVTGNYSKAPQKVDALKL